MPFEEGCRVVVEQIGEDNWQVWRPIVYTGHDGDSFDVYPGMETDFASVPRAFAWFIPRYGAYTKAAIVHDLLWREYASLGRMSYVDADGIFRRAMRELGVPFIRRWIMWAAVRWGALFKKNGRDGWLHDAPGVVLITVLTLPVLLPPAALVVAVLGIFYVAELLALVPLYAIQAYRMRTQGRVKRVNPPKLDWRT